MSNEEIEDALLAAITTPKSASGEAGSVTARDADDIGKLIDKRANERAARGSGLGARFFYTRPPGGA